MAVYQYTARDMMGIQVQGYLNGENEHDVVIRLREQGCTPVSIVLSKGAKGRKQRARRRPVRSQDLANFCWQLNTLVEGGVPITDALATIAEDIDNRHLQTVLNEVAKNMRSGETFHDSVAHYPQVFNYMFSAMIQAGESGGTMTTVLQRMADYYDRRDDIKRKVQRALAYPAFVVGFIALVIVVLMWVVIPRFENIFDSLGSRMPAFTLAFMDVYHFVMHNALVLFGGVFALVVGLLMFGKSSLGAQTYSSLALRLPMFGKLFRFAFLATYGRTMATLLDAGVSVLDAHQIVSKMTRNRRVKHAVHRATEQIAEGVGIAISLVSTRFFPRMMTKMVQVGEDSGSLPAVLDRVSDYYEKKVDVAVNALLTILEPALIVVVGSIVLTVLIALYLPVFAISDVGG